MTDTTATPCDCLADGLAPAAVSYSTTWTDAQGNYGNVPIGPCQVDQGSLSTSFPDLPRSMNPPQS